MNNRGCFLIIAHLIDSFHRFSHSLELPPQDGRPARGPGRAPPHMIMNGTCFAFLFCALRIQLFKDCSTDIAELVVVLSNGVFRRDLADDCHVDQLCL